MAPQTSSHICALVTRMRRATNREGSEQGHQGQEQDDFTRGEDMDENTKRKDMDKSASSSVSSLVFLDS